MNTQIVSVSMGARASKYLDCTVPLLIVPINLAAIKEQGMSDYCLNDAMDCI